MITLSKSGNTVTFTFDENSGYLQNGTIDVPINSLSLITDESDMATFRKSASNDIFISARYEEFGMTKAELEAWYKANMVSSGGGGGTGGTTPEEVQQMIDQSISGKQDTMIAGRGISITTGETADTVSFNLPIYSGNGENSIVEGSGNSARATGDGSHAEGSSKATGLYAHAEGESTSATGIDSHSEGYYTLASGSSSHAEGRYTEANNDYEHACGYSNVSTRSNSTYERTLFSVGNGTSRTNRHNAFEIKANGDIYLTSGNTDIKLQDTLNGKQDTLSAGTNITISGNVISAEGGTVDPSLDTGSTNAVANSAITTALNDTVKLSNLSTFYLNGFTNYVNRTIPIFHRFDINNQSNGNAWWFGKINDKYVITTGQTSVTPSDLMNLQVVETSAITTSITSSSTDAQVPSAKAVYDALGSAGGEVSSAITSGDTNAVAGGAVYDKFDEVEQVTAAALNNINDRLSEDEEVTAAGLNAVNSALGGLKLVSLTQAQYNSLATKDASTLYIIVN